MQNIEICESCESNQICKLKDEGGFIDLCPKRPKLLEDKPKVMANPFLEEQPLDLRKTYETQKETGGKRKKRSKQKIKDGQQIKLEQGKII